MDADGWFVGWPDAHMEKPDDEIRTMAGTSGLDFIRGLRLRDIYLRLRRIEEILATGARAHGGQDD